MNTKISVYRSIQRIQPLMPAMRFLKQFIHRDHYARCIQPSNNEHKLRSNGM